MEKKFNIIKTSTSKGVQCSFTSWEVDEDGNRVAGSIVPKTVTVTDWAEAAAAEAAFINSN